MQPCKICGNYHSTQCPWIKAIEFYPDGKVKRTEFHAALPVVPRHPTDFHDTDVVARLAEKERRK